MTSRRDFFKIIAGGITFTLAAKDIKVPPTLKTQAPATTQLGKELSKSLVPEGWHTVKITDIDIRDSKLRPGNIFFDFKLETKEGNILHSFQSPNAPYGIVKMLKKHNIPVRDSVELTQLIGKEIDIEVKIENFKQYGNVNKVEIK